MEIKTAIQTTLDKFSADLNNKNKMEVNEMDVEKLIIEEMKRRGYWSFEEKWRFRWCPFKQRVVEIDECEECDGLGCIEEEVD